MLWYLHNIHLTVSGQIPVIITISSKPIQISDGSVVSFQKTAVAVLASVVVFLITAVAVLMRLC